MYKIFVMNLGSTSTKMAYYEDDVCQYAITEEHPSQELAKYSDVMEQFDYRKERAEHFLKTHTIDVSDLDVIVSRGGNTKPVESGVYRINQTMLDQQASGVYGRHATDLGSRIAYEMSLNHKAIPLVVDPPVTDEFEPVARISGHPLFPRTSCFHALNHKATAKRFAADSHKHYEDLNLIVVHLGGGISVAPHKKGRMIDGDNALEGGGAFSTNRTGTLPIGALVEACFSGDYSKADIRRMLNGEGGLVAFLGTSDVRTVEEMAKTDEKAALCLDAMIYQVSKDIGAMSTVLYGQVDAILLTGGIANSKYVVQTIKDQCGFIAPIVVYPGENEMESLARGSLAYLREEEPLKEMA